MKGNEMNRDEVWRPLNKAKYPTAAFLDWLIVCLLTVLIIVIIICSIVLVRSGTKCIANPLVYGVKELNKINKQEVTCTCTNGNNFIFVSKNGISENQWLKNRS